MTTPILLITFNRPDHTRKVLERILEANPKDLYIFQDGARDGNENDAVKCQQVRDVIAELVGCEKLTDGQQTLHPTRCILHFYGSPVNLGCGAGPMTGISWFFENVEQGMIFEDDCLPSPTIFSFYEILLNRYKDDERISLITGTNALSKWCSWKYDYLFVKSGGMTMGCWASWRRAWKMFDWEVKSWGNPESHNKFRDFVGESRYQNWEKLMDEIYKNPPRDAWDYQWAYARTVNHTYSIVSTVNQMSNIGFCAESTHTPNENDRRANMSILECRLPLQKHTFRIAKVFDWEMYQRFDRKNTKSTILRVLLKLIDLICRR